MIAEVGSDGLFVAHVSCRVLRRVSSWGHSRVHTINRSSNSIV